MPKQKETIEFRYYNIPDGSYVLPKIGEGWEQEYGLGMNGMLHFHNLLPTKEGWEGYHFLPTE